MVAKWLARAKQSKYQPDLQEDIMEAERLEGNLTRMKGITVICIIAVLKFSAGVFHCLGF